MSTMLKLFITTILISCNNSATNKEEDRQIVEEKISIPLQDGKANVVQFTQQLNPRITQELTIERDEIYKDIFKQHEMLPPQIDILLVVDDSGSMSEEQANLSDKLNYLIGQLSEVDWLLNVITTDDLKGFCSRDSKLPIGPKTEGKEDIFLKAVKAGTSGSPDEWGLNNILRHIRNECRTGGPWLRTGAQLAVVIVTDEDEETNSPYYEKAEKFMEEMKKLGYIGDKNFRYYGILGHPSKPCSSIMDMALTHIEVVQRSKGVWGDICSTNYGPTLEKIAQDIRKNLKYSLPLTYEPLYSTLELTLNGVIFEEPWTLVMQDILLSKPMPEGTVMEITYQKNSTRLLPITQEKKGQFLLDWVKINDKLVKPEDYVFDDINGTILLSYEPIPGSKVTFQLIERKNFFSVFDFPVKEVSSKISCFLNDNRWTGHVLVKKKKITFDPPIPEGQKMTCLYL